MTTNIEKVMLFKIYSPAYFAVCTCVKFCLNKACIMPLKLNYLQVYLLRKDTNCLIEASPVKIFICEIIASNMLKKRSAYYT